MSFTKWQERLQDLTDRHLERKMRVVHGPVGPVISTEDGEKLNFCSNDYLGLANHPEIKRAMAEAALSWGTGAASSRLVSGNTSAHEQLEKALGDYIGASKSIVFPSGYQANVGALFALTEQGDAIFSDELVHASLVDGCRLSRAKVRVFGHGDMEHLEKLLNAESEANLKLIVTDAVFSMDGDLAPLREITDIADEQGALVYIDEAHAFGVLGAHGEGLTAELGLKDRVAVRIGTFGKALGTSGAFVACASDAAGLIRSRARALLYTTATPVPLIEATLASLEIVKRADDRRAALLRNIEKFKQLARKLHIPVLASDTAIQPVMVGMADRVMSVSEQLWKEGLFVQGIRPPTVPEGTSRLRVTLNASHEYKHIEKLAKELAKMLKGCKE